MSIQGSLATMNISDLLQFMEVSRKTGLLKVGRKAVTKEIYFEEGLIVGAVSNDPQEVFGQFLLHRGKLEETQLRTSMAKHRQTGERLGRVLITEGLLAEAEVVELLQIRNREAIYDLFLWEEGAFEFQDNVSYPEDLIRIEIRPSSVILEGVLRVDEWRRYRQLIPSDRTVLGLVPTYKNAGLQLEGDLVRILYCVRKRASVGEICYQLHASPFHVYSQLFELLSRGWLQVEGELAGEKAPPKSTKPQAEQIPLLLLKVTELIKEGKEEEALGAIALLLDVDPNNGAAQKLRTLAEEKFVQQFYKTGVSPNSILYNAVSPEELTNRALSSQEGFILSRINDSWDIKSILAVCPFREAESLQIIKRLLVNGLVRL